jgi:hypothetical protein
MKTSRGLTVVVLLTFSTYAFAYDDTADRVQTKASEYGDKFVSIWPPLGFTSEAGRRSSWVESKPGPSVCSPPAPANTGRRPPSMS